MIASPREVVLRVAQTRILPATRRPGFAVGVSILLQRFWRWVGTPKRVLFPPDGPPGPPRITPGSAIELHLSAHAPGHKTLHVYAESAPAHGSARLKFSPPQAIALDEDGQGRAVVRAEPEHAAESGHAKLRVVAVADDRPDEAAAEVSGIEATVSGTGGVVTAAVGAAFLIGFVAELWLREWPILAVLAIGALASIFVSRPKATLRFRPAALLPLGRRLRLAGAAVGGVALWIGLMWIGLDGASPFDPWCDDPGMAECGPVDVLVDNLTSIGAAFALFGLAALALAPALRPRRAAGQAMLVCAAVSVLFYDLTLLPGIAVSERPHPIVGQWQWTIPDDLGDPCPMSITRMSEQGTSLRFEEEKPACGVHGPNTEVRRIGLNRFLLYDAGEDSLYATLQFLSEDTARLTNTMGLDTTLTRRAPAVMGAHPPSELFDAAMLYSPVIASTRWFVAGFVSIGWLLGALGLVVLRIGWRSASWRGIFLLLAVGVIGLPAMVGYGAFLENPTEWTLPSLAFLVLVVSAARRALTPAFGWRLLREVVFWLIIGVCLLAIGGYLDTADRFEQQVRMWLPLYVCTIGVLWTLGEVALWQRRRRGTRTRPALGPQVGAPQQGATRTDQSEAATGT